MRSKPYNIYGDKKEWISAFVVGIICFAAYEYFGLDFYNFYIYFFLAGILSLCSSIIGWGALSYDGLLIRFGMFKIRKLFIKWEYIYSIKIVHIEKKFFIRFGGGFTLPTKDKIKIKAIEIKFSINLSEKLQFYIKKLERRMIFGQRIEFNQKSNALIMYEEPPYGFEWFIDKIEEFRPDRS